MFGSRKNRPSNPVRHHSGILLSLVCARATLQWSQDPEHFCCSSNAHRTPLSGLAGHVPPIRAPPTTPTTRIYHAASTNTLAITASPCLHRLPVRSNSGPDCLSPRLHRFHLLPQRRCRCCSSARSSHDTHQRRPSPDQTHPAPLHLCLLLKPQLLRSSPEP